MMKKIIALTLCLLMLIPVFASCAKTDENDKGAYISMYLTDPVYNFDPARAYGNEAALKVISLMFDNLFYLDSNGKVQKSLAKSYKIYEDDAAEEYKMIIDIKETAWSDGNALTAQDVVDAWITNPQRTNTIIPYHLFKPLCYFSKVVLTTFT